MSEFTMTIDGKGMTAEKRFGVINPATERVFAECPDCTQVQLDQAMEAAEGALPGWRRDEAKRRQVLLDCANAVKPRAEALAELLTREQGRTLKDTLGEINASAEEFETTARLEIPCDLLQDDEKARIELRRKPLGVVGAITPWNYPVILAVSKIAPALLAGNTMVLKPSPYTPLATLRLGEILRDVVPPGVLNIVSGGDALGAWITEHPAVRQISFTGSVATGKKVARAAAPDLKRIVLELGGNDPAIVLSDVNPKEVAEKLFWGAFSASGQVCIAIKRLYVHEKIYRPLQRELLEIARRVKVGDGLDPATEMGPINNRPQLERVVDLVEETKRAGARIVAGGRRLDRPGYFYPPTIVTDISDGARLVDEEQFGPVLPVMPFHRIDDALARANATHFGLGGSIWTNDLARGADLASQLECGTGWVNQHMSVGACAPFGGVKWSGIGYQVGLWGLESYSELQVVNIAKA
ncbi:MAG: aldehyde dehydrogenase family protein [Nitrospiria bacterium]